MRNFWGRQNLILVLSVFLISGLGLLFYFSQGQPVPPQFERVIAERGPIEVRVQATGVVQAQNRLPLKPPVAGRIEELKVVEGTEVKRGKIVGWVSSTERVALLDAARARGPKELKKWQDLYRPTPLIAPMTGVVISRSVEPGQTVTVQDPVLVLSDKLVIRADVDETDIGRLKVEQEVKLTLDAYPRHPFEGTVLQIAFDSKTVNNVTVYEVRVQPKEIPEFMRSGMTTSVSFLVARKENALILPSEAIQIDGTESFVLCLEENGAPTKKLIKVGLTDGKRTEVLEGLTEGAIALIPKVGKIAERSKTNNPFMPLTPGGRGRRGR